MFALSSTWLTVVMAVSRYVVVCRPLHARGYISLRRTRCALLAVFILRRTRCALLAVFILSAAVNVPRLLRYSVVTSPCSELDEAFANQTEHCNCVLYNKASVYAMSNRNCLDRHCMKWAVLLSLRSSGPLSLKTTKSNTNFHDFIRSRGFTLHHCRIKFKQIMEKTRDSL